MADTEIKIVAFVDILGFSQLIMDYDEGKDDRIFNLLKEAMHPAAKFMKESFKLAEGSPFFEWKDCLDVRLFSDCLCVAAPLKYKSYDFIEQLKFFYKYLMGYQSVLMDSGFFTRGGVTIGSHYADDIMIFSGGLVEAYQLESKKAVHPRIILSESLISEISKQKEAYLEALNYMIVKGHDNLAFFNHFNYNLMDAAIADVATTDFLKSFGALGIMDVSFLEKDKQNKRNNLISLKNTCNHILEKTEVESIRSKYLWLIGFIEFELGENSDFKTYKDW